MTLRGEPIIPDITRDTLIRDVLIGHDDAAAVFDRHGLACASCLASGMETVSAVASMHDVSVDSLLDELNALHPSSAVEE